LGKADLSGFTDVSKISAYAHSAMEWAVGRNLILGLPVNRLVPQGHATRAQAALILMRFFKTFAE